MSATLVKVDVAALDLSKKYSGEELLNLMNVLTAALTGQGTWENFKKNMKAGYVPTIWPRKLRKNASRRDRTYAHAQTVFTALIRAEGFKVFDGEKVA